MKKYAILSSDGLFVEAVATAPVVPEGAFELPKEFDLAQVLRCHAVKGEIVPRPELPPPVFTAAGVEIGGCPPGTAITVFDVELGDAVLEITTTADEPGLSLALPDPGVYQFELVPPAPWFGRIFNHEVSG